MENDATLEQMRSQIAILKKTLQKETLVNDRMVRNAIRNDYRVIRRHVAVEILLAGFVSVYAVTLMPMVLHSSWYFNIATVCFMCLCCFLTVRMTRKIRLSEVMTLDLAKAARECRKLKRNYDRSMYLGLTILAFWLPWFAYEVMKDMIGDRVGIIIIASGLVLGLVLGLFAGLRMRRKFMDACDDVIASTGEDSEYTQND